MPTSGSLPPPNGTTACLEDLYAALELLEDAGPSLRTEATAD